MTVTDSEGGTVTCPTTTLAAGDSMTCTASGLAIAGQYNNIGSVVGTPPVGANVSDSDPEYYFGEVADLPCDVDASGQVDRTDIELIFNDRGSAAAGPGDIRDFDSDGLITVNDARYCTLRCTNTNCVH